jgi:hypothetical protein
MAENDIIRALKRLQLDLTGQTVTEAFWRTTGWATLQDVLAFIDSQVKTRNKCSVSITVIAEGPATATASPEWSTVPTP